MAKSDDWLTGFRTPLMLWVMALVTGGAVLLPRQTGAPGESAPSPEGAKRTAQAGNRDTAIAALADARPIIQLLAEATGTRLDPNSGRRAALALRRLWAGDVEPPTTEPGRTARQKPSDAVLLGAIETLFPETPRADSGSLTPEQAAAQTAARDAALRTLRTFVPPPDGRNAAVTQQLARLLAAVDPSDDRANLEAIAEVAARDRTTVNFVVATAPDYVDSQVRRLFDPLASGIQQAAAALGFTLDRFYLPNAPGAPATEGRLHEDQPGAILFRRGGGSAPTELLLVLVTSETPTAGLHQRAFLAAVNLAGAWDAAFCRQPEPVRAGCRPRPLRVLGPTFSGTSRSLHLALERMHEQPGAPPSVQIVTGSATAPSNCQTLTSGYPLGLVVEFRSTVASNNEILGAVGRYLGRIRSSWGEGRGVALLVESNTVFGQSVSPRAGPPPTAGCGGGTGAEVAPPLQRAIRVRFPLHISRLRSAAAMPSATTRVGGARVRITLDESNAPTDLVPSATPELTASVVDAALRSLFASLRRQRISAIGILATDARDHLFLAREIRREMPDVQMFGTQSDLIYLNPDFAPFLRGTVISSPYPLFNETQLRTPTDAPGLRRQFSLSGEQGVYNALIALVAGFRACEPGSPYACINAPPPGQGQPPVLDFGPLGAQCTRGLCAPPVWLSAIARHELWPMATDLVTPGIEVLRVRAEPTPRDSAPDAFTTWAAGWLFLLGLFVTWFHAAGLLLAEYHRVRPPTKKPSPSAKNASSPTLRDQVGAACARRTHFRFDAWRTLHYLPSQVGREPIDYSTASTARRTQAERCADQAYDVTLNMLLLTLVLGNVWSFWWAWIFVVDSWDLAGAAALTVVGALTAGALCAAFFVTIDRLVRRAAERRAWRKAKTPGPFRVTAAWLRSDTVWGVFVTSVILLLIVRVLPDIAGLPSRGLAFTRAAALTSGISPTPPVVLLTSVFHLAAIWNLRRLKIHRYSMANGWWIGELLSGGSKAFVNQLRRTTLEFAPWQSSRLGTLLPFAVALVVGTAGCQTGYTIEGEAFTRWFWWASLIAMVAMARVAVRAAQQGAMLKQALDRLGAHPMASAYASVGGRPFDWSLSLSPLRRSALAPVVDEVRLLIAGADGLAHLPDRNAVLNAAETLVAEAEPWRNDRVPVMATREWRRLLDLGSVLTGVLIRHYWRSDLRLHRASEPPSTPPIVTPLARGELIVAYTLAFVIRNLLARVVSSLSTALIGFALILAAHLTYSFTGRAFWVRIDLACLTTTAIVTSYTLVRFERDRVLSLLWSTDPGRINWTGGFMYRIAVTVALPLILLIASLFPEITGSFTGMIEPLQKALP